jgi:hypothetical protein
MRSEPAVSSLAPDVFALRFAGGGYDAMVARGTVSSRRRTAWVAALVILATVQPAAAQTPSPPPSTSPSAEARRAATYAEAAAAAAEGRWADAREKLRAVLAIRSSPKVLFSLAQAEEQLGQVASAQADYRQASQGALATPGEGDVVAAADAAQRSLESRVPHVRVEVSGPGASAASATLDDQPIALGTAVAVDPGGHRVTVTAPGMQTSTTSISIAERQQVVLPVRLEALAEATVVVPARHAPMGTATPVAPADAATPATSAAPWQTVGRVVAGAGVVAMGVGAAFGVLSIHKHDDAQKACPASTCPDASGVSLWHDAVNAGNVSTIALVLGGVAAAGGIVLWLAAPRAGAGRAAVGLGPGLVQGEVAW